MSLADTTLRVAIVGGGFTGAAVATHLALRTKRPLAIEVFEPRAALGGGVAYSSHDPAHRTNVAAKRMSLFSADQTHFERWLLADDRLRDDPHARLDDGRIYPQRQVFGAYVAAQLEEATWNRLASVRHRRESVVAIHGTASGWAIATVSDARMTADIVVLAVSHPPPAVPPTLARTIGPLPGFVRDPWADGALDRIGRHDDVIVMGTALSMADVVASLDRRGHAGRIVAFSRRGMVSRPHAARAHEPFGELASSPPATALELLARLRRMVRQAGAEGQPWQAVIDAARRDGQAIWQVLGEPERRRLLRHLRPWWEVHRYRIAPQVDAVIERRRAEGTLEIVAAALGEVRTEGRDIVCELRLRGRRAGEPGTRRVRGQAFVLTTGPAHGGILSTNPALHSLAAEGLVQADEHGLGIKVDRGHRVIARDGNAIETLLVAGPLARATFGELMGLPQVTRDAEDVADAVLDILGVAPASPSSLGAPAPP